jgi:hypothetical protein
MIQLDQQFKELALGKANTPKTEGLEPPAKQNKEI